MVSVAQNPLPGVPLVESPLFDKLLPTMDLTEEERQIAIDLNRQGFAVFDFPLEDFDEVADRIKAALVKQPEFADVAEIGPDHPVAAGRRIQDLVTNPDVRLIAGNERVIEILTKLYGRPAFPFQTLNFALGTEQHYHSDSNHFSSVPERFMAGVWVALEDIGPDQGPLVYYPGSHKWPIIHNDEVGISLTEPLDRGQAVFEAAWQAYVDANEAKPAYFHAKKGQALIWAANLLHGGVAHKDRTRTRWSQVTHYYFEDCTYTTPMFSNPRVGSVYIRKGTKDLRTGKLVPNTYLGRPVEQEATKMNHYRELARRAMKKLTRGIRPN